MAIIKYTKNSNNIKYAYLNIFPDQFKTEKEKEEDTWIKETMDYFANKAYAEYVKNRETFVKNYDLVKGILRLEDFYEDPEVKSFAEILTKDLDLPKYVKHYSIITTPINELVGELSKRPDEQRVKAFDDESKSEELEFKTQILQQYILTEAKVKIQEKLAMQGEEVDEEELERLTFDQVKEDLEDYTSVAESWANHVLTATKAEFNLKEKSEDAFRDMLISSQEYYHVYEDNSKTGFNIEVENPKNVWKLISPDKKFVADPTGRAQGAYAIGTVKVMELSEIIELIPEITKEEIDHLRSAMDDYGLINVRESNLFTGAVGADSIKYDTYDPLVQQERMLIESEMKENNDGLKDFLGLTNNVSAFGYKYVVVTAYWISKRKIGKVSYLDELNNLQTTLVDENYKSGTIPTEISLEWGWINQWYMGRKIGPDIYHVKPFKLLGYSPIIGVINEIKNTEPRSTVDMMKPFQVLYNICMNQLYELLKKEIGNVAVVNLRRVPRVKDGDGQDDIDVWEMEAKQRGVMFDDDSPENTKAPVSNTSVAKNLDLTRTNEMQSRYNLAVQLKNECWELIGMSKQRLGSISASETATGTNTAITQSYSQTEPQFVVHEYTINQLYQAIIDAALYIASQKEESTVSYISSQGESAFVKVNGADLRFRDLKVFVTNRPEDKKAFEELRMLAQPMLQNGGSFQEVIELWSTDSMRKMKKVFRKLRERQEELQQTEFQQNEQKMQQDAQIAQATLEQNLAIEENRMANENYNKEMDRINKKEVAIISALGFGKQEGEDINNNEIPDLYEAGKFALEKETKTKEHQLKLMELQSTNAQEKDKLSLEKEKIKVERENMQNDLQIARINAKSKAKAAKSTAKKKKK
jgi:hypothetical protein